MSDALGRSFRLMLGFLATALSTQSATSDSPPRPPPPPPPLAHATMAPALKAAADRDHIPLYTIDPTDDTPREGDSTVAWVGASNAKGKRQWLIQFRRSIASPAERASAKNREKKKYLSWGPVVTFKSDVEALDLWIAGPIQIKEPTKADEIAPVKRLRVLVPADYLRLGLDNSLRVDEHIRRRLAVLQAADPAFNLGNIYSLEKPIKPENVAYAKPVAEKIQFTPEMERAWAGGYVALEAFYNLANDVPEIEAIASIAVEKPSVWKLAKLATGTQFMTYFGGSETRAIDPAKLGLLPVSTETFDAQFSFGFGADPIVTGVMVVTKPIPPIDTTAGILALIAIHPKDPTRQVHIALVSGVRGKSPATTVSGK